MPVAVSQNDRGASNSSRIGWFIAISRALLDVVALRQAECQHRMQEGAAVQAEDEVTERNKSLKSMSLVPFHERMLSRW
jgi:hypothetical protein